MKMQKKKKIKNKIIKMKETYCCIFKLKFLIFNFLVKIIIDN